MDIRHDTFTLNQDGDFLYLIHCIEVKIIVFYLKLFKVYNAYIFIFI